MCSHGLSHDSRTEPHGTTAVSSDVAGPGDNTHGSLASRLRLRVVVVSRTLTHPGCLARALFACGSLSNSRAPPGRRPGAGPRGQAGGRAARRVSRDMTYICAFSLSLFYAGLFLSHKNHRDVWASHTRQEVSPELAWYFPSTQALHSGCPTDTVE